MFDEVNYCHECKFFVVGYCNGEKRNPKDYACLKFIKKEIMETKLDKEILVKNGYKECYLNSRKGYFESPDKRVLVQTDLFVCEILWTVYVYGYWEKKRILIDRKDVANIEQLNQLLRKYNVEELKSADCNVAGDYEAATAGGYGAATAGHCGAATAGDYGAATAGGCGAANVGDRGVANVGNSGVANAGYKGSANAGDNGAANAGYRGVANAGDNGVAVVSNEGKVKGGLGCILVARNIEYNNKTKRYEVADWACTIVDGEKIKADTWYHLANGELKEVEQVD